MYTDFRQPIKRLEHYELHDEQLKKNSEVRIQESEFRSRGFRPRRNCFALASRREDHQIFIWWGAKTPIIQTRRSNTRSKRSHAAGFTLRYPPVHTENIAEF
ncbi:hypothetical protein [Nostoc commune]|uniref:hypothetical protein n=1 Tax=Nostoc commune TaxID=1178 RepID=UPI00207423BD|nr:hypothetical protein [Nostoc commune]